MHVSLFIFVWGAICFVGYCLNRWAAFVNSVHMDSRRASFEAGSSSADSQEPRSPSFVPCRSPSNDNTQVFHWSQIPSSQPLFPFMERPIPLRHPYLQPQFVGQRAETLLTVRSQQPMFQIPVSVPPVPVVPMVPNLPGVEDGADGVGGQRSRTRNSAAFNWDHQAILFLIDAKRREWEDFELKH